LKLRKQVFVDRLEWPLFYADEVEFEQYDSLDTTYVICLEGDEVIGGARLRRTDHYSGHGSLRYSYMIRDACLGHLPGLPATLCDDMPPSDSRTWELTRMIVNGPKSLTEKVLEEVNLFLLSEGATTCLFLGSPAFLRMARRLDWPAQPLGPVCGNADGRFQVIEVPVRPLATPVHAHLAEAHRRSVPVS
jgi:acyl homoserine lactone synthase